MTTRNDVWATRKRLGWSQRELAEALSNGRKPGVAVKTISRWETGEVEPPPYLKFALRWIEEHIEDPR